MTERSPQSAPHDVSIPLPARFLVVEGPIGVGKTSFCQLLARELSAQLVLEDASDNPFLETFYDDPRRSAFQTQIFFLLSRYRRLQDLNQLDLFNRTTITDFFFPKDRIFATLTLAPDELDLYDQLYRLLNPRVPPPDLVIYLQASTEVLRERIQRRGLSYERPISFDYIAAVNAAYNEFFFGYSDSPLLVIQTSEIDFVNSRDDLDDLIRQIKLMRKGTQYYNPRR